MRRLLLILALLGFASPAGAAEYSIPPGNPFAGMAGARPEVFHYGLRNPFRFSFDRDTSAFCVGDVGGSQKEEVSRALPGQAGLNFGWNCREGSVAGPGGCSAPGALPPLLDYDNPPTAQAAVTGGVVVRDPGLPSLAGKYLFGDHYDVFTDTIQVKDPSSAAAYEPTGLVVDGLVSFGEDGFGRVYVVSINGPVRRLSESGGTLATTPVGDFSAPIGVEAPAGDSRLFVPELGGTIKVVTSGGIETFLDISSLVSTGGERGLLGLAFAPDYSTSGRLYVFYTDDEPGDAGDLRIDEFRRLPSDPDRADPASRRPVIAVEHSSRSNHNGGQVHFGPDGYLYWSTGDGGGQGDPEGDAQNRGSLLGKILRIDPRRTAGAAGGAASGAGSGSGAAAVADRAAPRLRTRTRRRQRVLRNRGVVLYARCNETCRVRAKARLRIGRRSYRLQSAVRRLRPHRRYRLEARLGRRGRRALRRAHRRRRKARVRVAVRASDRAGNVSRWRRVAVRARR